jgi:hypothetical protein
MIYELDSTVNVKKWEMDISRPGARRKPTPTTEEFLSIFRNDPDNPRSCLLSASELRLKFRSRGWEDNSAPALRDECEGAGKLAIFHGAHNLKLVGLPAMVEAFRKKLSEKNSILEQVPLVTKQRGKKRKK